jgi:hypothetical protein
MELRTLAVLAALFSCRPAGAAVLNAAARSTAPVDAGSAPAAEESGGAQREDYERRALKQVDELRGQADAAERKAAELGAQARREAERQVSDLQKRLDAAEKQAADLQRAEAERWSVIRRHLESTLQSARREYESLRKDLDKKSSASEGRESDR